MINTIKRKAFRDLTIPRFREANIVDVLIAERGEGLVSSPFWPLLRPFLYKILMYKNAVRMADDVEHMSGCEAFNYVSECLRLKVSLKGVENIPSQGACLIAPNHPTGIADGIAFYDAAFASRPDMIFFANRDALRVCPRLDEMIIPVEWRKGEKTHAKSRETLLSMTGAFKEERAIILYPSGRIAYFDKGALHERPWQPTLVQLAQKFKTPIIPVNIKSRNSGLFYYFAKHHTELRDMTVFYELLNKKGKAFEIIIGKPIEPDMIEGEAETVTALLQHHTVTVLAQNPEAEFIRAS